MSDSNAILEPDALFVVACPICQGQVAAAGGLCGNDACCPLCASLFHVPFPTPADRAALSAVPQPRGGQPAGVAEDWGGVIRQLAPARQDRDPAPEPELPTTTPAEFDLPEADAAPGRTVDQDPAAGSAEPATEGLPVVGGTPLDPAATELVFSEPVRTIRHGNTVIEIRRLTPEERRARRFRRNVLMIVVGVSILLATYILLT
jgi:hypothetical protein